MGKKRRGLFVYSWDVGGKRPPRDLFVYSWDVARRDSWGDPALPSSYSFGPLRSWREPFVSTPEDVVHRMLKIAEVQPNERVYDLGCGDGRFPIIAAKHFRAYGVGVEIQKSLVREARNKATEFGVAGRVTIIHRSFKKVDLRDADVVTLYLTSGTLAELEGKFKKELRPGARIATYDYPIYGWTSSKIVNVKSRERHLKSKIYLYVK